MSRAVSVPACAEHDGAMFLVCWQVLRAERVSSCAECLASACALFVGRSRELSVYIPVLGVCPLES